MSTEDNSGSSLNNEEENSTSTNVSMGTMRQILATSTALTDNSNRLETSSSGRRVDAQVFSLILFAN